jgi:branched-chain amino acid transport system permease protein
VRCSAVVTEILTVRPVLKSIEQHLYVLSTLAFALMVQQVDRDRMRHRGAAVPRADPDRPNGWASTRSSGCRCWPAPSPSAGLEFLYRKTLIGRAFLAIAEDSYAPARSACPRRGSDGELSRWPA